MLSRNGQFTNIFYSKAMSVTKKISKQAKQALDEAEKRRRKADLIKRPLELKGRGGPEPTRYGDWEVKGITSDF